VVVALAAALVTMLVNRKDEPADTAQGGGGSTETAQTAADDRSTSREEPPSSGPTTTTTTATTTTTTTTTTVPQAPPPPADPAAAVISYYALMPGNRDEAWTRLTARFQDSPAKGRASYDRFWNRVSGVTASEVAATGPASVEVTVVYNFTDGTRTQERHAYTLVNQNGAWLLDTVNVLTSRPA
jgi:hypothetical protein